MSCNKVAKAVGLAAITVLVLVAGQQSMCLAARCRRFNKVTTSATSVAPVTHWVKWDASKAPAALTIHRGDTIKIYTRAPGNGKQPIFEPLGWPDVRNLDKQTGPVLQGKHEVRRLNYTYVQIARFEALRAGEAELVLFSSGNIQKGRVKVTVILSQLQAAGDALQDAKYFLQDVKQYSGVTEKDLGNIRLGAAWQGYYVSSGDLLNWKLGGTWSDAGKMFKRDNGSAIYPVLLGSRVVGEITLQQEDNGNWALSELSTGSCSRAAREQMLKAMKANPALNPADFILVNTMPGQDFLAYQQIEPVDWRHPFQKGRRWYMISLYVDRYSSGMVLPAERIFDVLSVISVEREREETVLQGVH